MIKKITGKTFQSSPSPKAGSYAIFSIIHKIRVAFQSSPSPKAGSYFVPG